MAEVVKPEDSPRTKYEGSARASPPLNSVGQQTAKDLECPSVLEVEPLEIGHSWDVSSDVPLRKFQFSYSEHEEEFKGIEERGTGKLYKYTSNITASQNLRNLKIDYSRTCRRPQGQNKSDLGKASYNVEYLGSFWLEANLGADIPLYDMHFTFTPKQTASGYHYFEPHRKWGKEFNHETQDYWLFKVYMHREATLQIYVGSYGCWLTSSTHYGFWPEFKKHDCQFLYTNREFARHRYIAIVTPKIDNPAVTIHASKGWAEVEWTGLFVKASVDNNHEFVILKTTNRLLPKYAEMYQNESWFSRDSGVAIVDRYITMFPKQLYGTNGIDQKSYEKFVTSDPNTTLGCMHSRFWTSRVWNWTETKKEDQLSLYARNNKAYMWYSTWKTVLAYGWNDRLDYCTGIKFARDDGSGWDALFKIFTTLTVIVGHLCTGNVAAAVIAVISGVQNEVDQSTATKLGFISALVETVNSISEIKLKINTKTVGEISRDISNRTAQPDDFGIITDPGWKPITPSLNEMETIKSGPYGDSNGGQLFSLHPPYDTTVRKIRVWEGQMREGFVITGIEIYYPGLSSQDYQWVAGRVGDDTSAKSYTFKENETVTRFELKTGYFVDKIKFETSLGGYFTAGGEGGGLRPVDIGNGKLVGLEGGSGDAIDKLAVIFQQICR